MMFVFFQSVEVLREYHRWILYDNDGKRQLLDRVKIEQYTIEVLAIDQGTPQLNGSATVIITLNDVQDSHPKFTQSVYNFTIDENSLYDVGTIKATLADKDFRHALDYRITSHSNK